MFAYIIRRLLLIIPTLLGIMILNFIIVQAAPGGPIEQIVAKLQGNAVEATARVSGGGSDVAGPGQHMKGNEGAAAQAVTSRYKGAQGVDPELILELEKQFGFDQPMHIRFLKMMKNYLVFDFGTSYFRDQKVFDLVVSKLPVSISLGLWTMVIVYLVSIPLGIRKAVKDGTPFDIWSSAVIITGYAIPSFLLAIFLIVVFAGGRYLDWFPLRGLVSDNWRELSTPTLILDYFWHLTLPLLAMIISGFASLTMLTKNSFLDEINKQYVLTAHAKGLEEKNVLYGHVFRNAMLIVIAGFPAHFIATLFTGSLLIEVIFSLDGMGLLGFESAINRDYPVMFGTLYFFTLLGLIMNLIGDLMYMAVDPRIDFESREM
ncbi:MAG: microcin C ABC transporter permease YejB [Alphaproteobacteria bacterium]|jgi:microcin C transport system permease protein|nr:microcin C ABC transporter permease YejB [Alphaproteobacteria bacterium]